MIEKITPRKLNNSKDARIQGAIEMYDAYNLSINEFTDTSGDSSFSGGTISGTDTGDQGVVKPAKGNHKVNQTLTDDPTISRRIIGSVSDEVNGRIYCFLRSSVGEEHGVYAIEGDELVAVFTSKLFNFPSNGFVKADIVYAKNGPIIYFTDGENEPRKLHVSKASQIQGLNLDSSDTLRVYDFITACPKTPMHRPTFTFESDPSVASNFAGTEGFQFAFQCIYDTGEETALSPYSNVAVPPSYLNQGSLSEPALNTDNVIKVSVPVASSGVTNFTENVSKIRLLVRIGGRGSFFEVQEKDYNVSVASFNSGNIVFKFSNDTVLSGVPQEDADKLNDAVPKKAKAQAVVNDRLMYGNYTEGFNELDKVDCSLSAFYNPRGEEFTNLEIGIKKLILPVGYGMNNSSEGSLIYDSELKPSGTAADNSGTPGSLVYNRRTAYQFDLSQLPSVIDAGTQLRIRLTIRPDKNLEIYDSRNSFHAFKNVGYDAGQNDPDSMSLNPDTIRAIKKADGSDAETPAVVQFNNGVILDGVSWTRIPSDGVRGSVASRTISNITTGHSPSCPFIIPTTSMTFSIALDFNESVNGAALIKTDISNCLINYFSFGNIEGDGSYPVTSDITLVNLDSNDKSSSIIDQGLNNDDGYGQLNSSNRDVAETIMKVYDREVFETLVETGSNTRPPQEIPPCGFMAINRAELKCGLHYSAGPNEAVSGGGNDIGPIFSLQVEELNSADNPSNPPEYVTMIPRVYTDGVLNWWWATRDYMSNATNGDLFLGDTFEGIGFDSNGFSVDYLQNENLFFGVKHPFPNGIEAFQSVFNLSGTPFNALIRNNFFADGVLNEDISEDFNNTDITDPAVDPVSSFTERRDCIGYPSFSPAENRILKIVSLDNNFSENEEYNLYSIVDGEAHVRRSTVSNPENQNFWYGMLYGCEYLGKQNNMFPLSRGWQGGGGYPGLLQGLFSYGNKSSFGDASNPDGNIDSDLSATALDFILDQSYPEAEVLNFASAVYNSSVSLDPQSRSFKRYCSHDFGVVFFDERGRHGNVNPLGSVYVGGFAESQNTGSAFVTAKFINNSSNIPSWAHYYKIVYGGNSTISDFVQYTAGGAFVAADSGGTDGLIYVSLNHLQENADVSYTKAFGAVKEDGDKDMYTFSAGDKLRIISYFDGEESTTRQFVNEADHRFDVVGTVTLGKEDNPLVGENEDVHPAKMGQFVILKNNFRASGFSFDDVSQSQGVGAGLNTSDIYDNSTNYWNKRCVFEIYSPAKKQEAEDRVYYEVGKTYNIIKEAGQRKYQVPVVVITEGDVFFRKSAVNMQKYDGNNFLGLIGNGNGTFEERSEPNFESYYLESKTFTDSFPNADVKPYGKPRIISREKSETVSPSSIKFSDKTVSNSNLIRYTSFNNSKFPYKDLQNSDGPISYLLNLNDSLFCIQQLKCSSIPVSRNILSDALGNETVITSKQVLGTEKYYSGTYGTTHPESVVDVDNVVYFASSDQRKVYRFDSSQGIEVISGKGMGSFFDRTLLLDKSKKNRVVGGYDPDTDEFILSVNKDIEEFSSSGFISPPSQPDGAIIQDDSIEGFVGITDGVGGGLGDNDEFAEALIITINQVINALEQNNQTVISILDGISNVQSFLNEDFSGVGFDFTIPIPVGDTVYELGPFVNNNTYNAELQELQSSLFISLFEAMEELLNRYQQLDSAYENAIIVTFNAAGTLEDNMQVLNGLLTTASPIVGLDAVEQAFADSGLTANLSGQILDQATAARLQIADVYNLFNSTAPTPVDIQYLFNEVYGVGDINVPEGISVPEPFDVKFLSPGIGTFETLGDQIDAALLTYRNAVQFISGLSNGVPDVSAVVNNIFQVINGNIAEENTQINNLLIQLYGPDLTPDTADDSQGLYGQYNNLQQNYDTLLSIAYGDDQTPLDEGGDGVGGLEGQVKTLESVITNFEQVQDDLYNAAGQYYADIYALKSNNGEVDFSFNYWNEETGAIETRTKSFSLSPEASTFAQNYGSPGSGYTELVQLLGNGLIDSNEFEETLADLQTNIANRTQVMNEVFEDFLNFPITSYNDEFRIENNPVVPEIIASIISVLQQRIPSAQVLNSLYAKLYYHYNQNGDFIQTPTDEIGSVYPVENDGVIGSVDVDVNDIASASGGFEALYLSALDKSLETILKGAFSDNGVGIYESAYSLLTWYKAWNNIASNNPEYLNPVSNYGIDFTSFGNQIIEDVNSGGGGGPAAIETFTDLINLFDQLPLSADQVKFIINAFRPEITTVNEDGNIQTTRPNASFYFDDNGDGGIATQDLLAFLAVFGSPSSVGVGFLGKELDNIGIPS